MKKVIAGVSFIISLLSVLMLAGVPNVSNWWELSIPYLIICLISLTISLVLTFPNQIRRVTYPMLVCLSAWAYKHKVLMTRFTRSTYRVYRANHSSYGELFGYTQALFDIYVEGLENN